MSRVLFGRPDDHGYQLHKLTPERESVAAFCLPSFLSAGRTGFVIFCLKRSSVKSRTSRTPIFASGSFLVAGRKRWLSIIFGSLVRAQPFRKGCSSAGRAKECRKAFPSQILLATFFGGCRMVVGSPLASETGVRIPLVGNGHRLAVRTHKPDCRYLLPL
jgi:hypothetical protein